MKKVKLEDVNWSSNEIVELISNRTGTCYIRPFSLAYMMNEWNDRFLKEIDKVKV